MANTTLENTLAKVTAPGQPYETETVNVDGIEFIAFANAPQNLCEIYRSSLQHKKSIFYIYKNERYTYNDAWEHAAKVANKLKAIGVKKGDRIGIALRNYPEWIFTFMGISAIGATAVAINAWWSGKEIEYSIQDSGLQIFFADKERVARLQDRIEKLGIQVISVRSFFDGIQTWEDFVSGCSSDMPDAEVVPDDYATLLYTSGSTAHPKGVLSTHRAITNALLGWECVGIINTILMRENHSSGSSNPRLPVYPPYSVPDRLATMLTVPLFHVTGLVFQFLSSFRNGRKLVGMYKWNAEKALHIIAAEKIMVFNGIPTMTWELVQSPNCDKYDLSSLRRAGGGGAPMTPEHVRQIEKKLGKGTPSTGWGMTETQGLATGVAGEAFLQRPSSCGRAALPLVKVKAVDDNGNDCVPGETGELCIWGVMNFSQYLNDPVATSETLVDGWVHSGDIGYLDEEGYVFITDRKKDMVLRSGENIGCQEVEAVLYEHPKVLEAAVFGVPDERMGETVAAVICEQPASNITEDEIRDFVAVRLAKFKVPDHVWIQTERLPRTASEKIYKRVIRAEAIGLLNQKT